MAYMLTLEHEYLTLRPAQAADDAFLKALYASTRDDLRAAAPTPAMLELLMDMQWRAQSGGYRQSFPAADSLVVEATGTPAGRLLLDRSLVPWRIVDIALLPQARGQGHGTAVLQALQKNAAAAGMALALRVRLDNPGARRLYAGLGFVVDGGDGMSEQMVWNPPP